jgi:hypothetical protein
MDPRKIDIDEYYHARRPRRLTPISGPGISRKAWRVRVAAKGQVAVTDSGRTVKNGVLVIDETGQSHAIEAKLVLSTWADYERKIAEREREENEWEQWEAARAQEIADAHLTLMAALQRRGIAIPDKLLTPLDDWSLSAAELLEMLGEPALAAAAQVRPLHRPEPIKLPEPISAAEREQRMLVLQAVADCIESLARLNREDPVDLRSVARGLGASEDEIDDEPVLGYVREIAHTDSVARRLQGTLRPGQVKRILSALRRDKLIWHHQGGAHGSNGWTMTATGRASLAEWAVA